jgi:sterol desaturase/sphingolipid hydroxylase (fatty acid hydroxylase superfamily)
MASYRSVLGLAMTSVILTTWGRIRSELELPRSERPFGSGWLSGSVAVLAGLTSVIMVVALKYPALLLMPDLGVIRDGAWFKPTLFFVLLSGFVLASLSLVLRNDRTLGVAAMALTLLASAIGSFPTHPDAMRGAGVFLGLDFFVLNVLLMGFLFVPLERLFPRVKDQILFREEWREDVFYYLVSSLFVQILTFLTLAPSKAITAYGHIGDVRAWIGGMPWLLQLALVMLLTDLTQYWVHRAFHRVPALWRFHAVHHSAKSLDWLAGARMHFVEIIVLRSLTATPMFALGFQESAIQVYILIVYVYSAFIHSNVDGAFGIVERLFVVPRFHHWHHGVEREAIDVNFAIHFPVLDRLFGTHHMPAGRWPEGYGIAGHPVPRGYWAQFMYPFRRDKASSMMQSAAPHTIDSGA